MTDNDSLPHNLDAEKHILGACMVNPAAVDIAAAVVAPGDFYRGAHARVWNAIVQVHASGAAVDLTTVRDALDQTGHLEDVGGPAYVAALPDGMPKSANVASYTAIVRRCRLERDLVLAAGKADVEGALAAAEALKDLDVSAAPDSVAPFVALGDAETGAMVPDVVLPGLAWRGALSVIGGAPKAGKSTLVGQAIGAACTGKPFLGHPPGHVGLIAYVTEEALRTTATRLKNQGADEAGVFLASTGARGLWSALRKIEPALLVLDSFAAFAVAAGAESLNDAAGMRRVTNTLRTLADEKQTAVLLVHHARKSDGALADSRDIAAAVDVILDFYPVNDVGDRCAAHDSNRRRIYGVGRWPVETAVLEYDRAAGDYTGCLGADDGDSWQNGIA